MNCRSIRKHAAAGAALAVLAALAAAPAHAALGQPLSSALADGSAAPVPHVLRAAGATQVTDTAVVTPAGTLVHEFSGSDGVVFALAWSGMSIPDLPQLLGSYFPAYRGWLQAHPPVSYRAPVRVRDAQVVAHAWGHMGAYSGSAYVPALVPAGVDLMTLGVTP